MARTAVILCCAVLALAVFSSNVAAQHSKSATLTDKTLKVEGEKGDVEFSATFPTKDCKKACKETCTDKEVETCNPVTIHKCKNVPKTIKTCEDVPVKKIVKQCKNTCEDSGSKTEIKITKKEAKTVDFSVGHVKGRRMFAPSPAHKNTPAPAPAPAHAHAAVVIDPKKACVETCKDVEVEETEEECKEKVVMKEKCEEVVEDECEKETKPFCTTECAVTCVPKVAEAVAGAVGVVGSAAAMNAPKGVTGLLGAAAKHLG